MQIDVCRGRLALLRYALPVGCSLLCLFHPVPALRQKIFVFDLFSQRRSLTVSLGICLLSHGSHIYKQGGPRSLLSLRPSIPFKLDPALRYAVRLNSLAPRSIRSEPGSRTFSHRFPSPSHRQKEVLIPWCQRAE